MHTPSLRIGGTAARIAHRYGQLVMVTCTVDGTLGSFRWRGGFAQEVPIMSPLVCSTEAYPAQKGEKRQIEANMLAPELLRHTDRLPQEQSRKSRWRRT